MFIIVTRGAIAYGVSYSVLGVWWDIGMRMICWIHIEIGNLVAGLTEGSQSILAILTGLIFMIVGYCLILVDWWVKRFVNFSRLARIECDIGLWFSLYGLRVLDTGFICWARIQVTWAQIFVQVWTKE